ncbi:MAG: SPASM domain-containing protein [Lachnospiraceae bacterium]
MPLKKLYIEPTSHCNFNCDMCFRHTWFDETYAHMTYDMFQRILVNLPSSVDTIFFGGMGEPFFHPRILDMLSACKGLGVRVEVLTNGSLLTKEVIEALIAMRLDKLWISIDSFETFEKPLVGHPNMSEIFEHMKLFNTMRFKAGSSVQLGITFVVTKSNVEELEKLPYFIDKYSIQDVNISNMYPASTKDNDELLYQRTLSMSIGSDKFGEARPKVNLPYMDFDIPQVKQGVTKLFEKMNFNLLVGNIPVPRRSQYCRFVSEGMCFVRSDGEVSPCMALLHNGTTAIANTNRRIYHHSFGSVRTQSIAVIWESEEYVAFRERVDSFSFSPCTNCGHCHYPEDNREDCFGNEEPTCGACLWAEGILSCP